MRNAETKFRESFGIRLKWGKVLYKKINNVDRNLTFELYEANTTPLLNTDN